MSGVELILSALESIGHPARQRRGSWVARCPVHGSGGGDSTPSFAMTDKGGTPLLYCFAGCRADAIISALGLTWPQILGGSADEVGAPRRHTTSRMVSEDRCECVMPVPDDGTVPAIPDAIPGAPGLL